MDDIENWKEKITRENLINRANKHTYDFHQCETIRYFGESIYTGKITIGEAEIDQSNLLKNMVEFNNKSRPKNKENKGGGEILLIVYF